MFLTMCVIVAYAVNQCAAKPAISVDNDHQQSIIQNAIETTAAYSHSYPFPFVTRSGWGARAPKEKSVLVTPVPYVVIHHSYSPKACYNGQDCDKAMRAMQNFHMDGRGWWDVGYNFAVGSDGVVYEGRGWQTLGAHAKNFNRVSLGICLIGDWTKTSPPSQQLKSAQTLIASGVKLGYIQSEYKLVGHRQVRDTECPGGALYDVIRSWQHYTAYPASEKDAKLVVSGIVDDVDINS